MTARRALFSVGACVSLVSRRAVVVVRSVLLSSNIDLERSSGFDPSRCLGCSTTASFSFVVVPLLVSSGSAVPKTGRALRMPAGFALVISELVCAVRPGVPSGVAVDVAWLSAISDCRLVSCSCFHL